LREHQRAALTDIVAALADGPRATAVLPCGAGKTRLAAAFIAVSGARRAVVFVPSLGLVEQTLREFATVLGDDMAPVIVCSDPGTAAGAAERADAPGFDERGVGWAERSVPVTTDQDRLAVLLGRHGHGAVGSQWLTPRAVTGRPRLSQGPDGAAPAGISASTAAQQPAQRPVQVVVSTYHSAGALADGIAFAAVPVRFDVLIADEAHRLAGRPSPTFRAVLDDLRIPAAVRLFLTATPVVSDSDDDSSRPSVSMDDRKLFGPLAHRLSFAAAIKAGLLSDYRVVVVAERDRADGGQVPAAETVGTAVEVDGSDSELATLSALRQAATRFGLRRAVTFHGRVRAAERFAGLLRQSGPLPDGRQVWSRIVDSTMSSGERRQVLAELADADEGTFAVVSNARCLGEGVDVPAIDTVVFAHAKHSLVDIVQAVGRALRTAEGKQIGTIVIPVTIPAGQDDDTAMLSGAFAHAWTVLRALRAHDERFSHQLDELTIQLARRGRLDGTRQVDRLTWLLPEGMVPAATVRLAEQAGSSWERMFALLTDYVGERGNARVRRSYRAGPGRATLGDWVERQRIIHQRGLLPADRAAGWRLCPAGPGTCPKQCGRTR
jgi:predicted helicase